MASKIETDGSVTMRCKAKELNNNDRTIRRSVSDLGAVSYIAKSHQLQTEDTKKGSVRKDKKILSR